jgi:hypothetical protein
VLLFQCGIASTGQLTRSLFPSVGTGLDQKRIVIDQGLVSITTPRNGCEADLCVGTIEDDGEVLHEHLA